MPNYLVVNVLDLILVITIFDIFFGFKVLDFRYFQVFGRRLLLFRALITTLNLSIRCSFNIDRFHLEIFKQEYKENDSLKRDKY